MGSDNEYRKVTTMNNYGELYDDDISTKPGTMSREVFKMMLSALRHLSTAGGGTMTQVRCYILSHNDINLTHACLTKYIKCCLHKAIGMGFIRRRVCDGKYYIASVSTGRCKRKSVASRHKTAPSCLPLSRHGLDVEAERSTGGFQSSCRSESKLRYERRKRLTKSVWPASSNTGGTTPSRFSTRSRRRVQRVSVPPPPKQQRYCKYEFKRDPLEGEGSDVEPDDDGQFSCVCDNDGRCGCAYGDDDECDDECEEAVGVVDDDEEEGEEEPKPRSKPRTKSSTKSKESVRSKHRGDANADENQEEKRHSIHKRDTSTKKNSAKTERTCNGSKKKDNKTTPLPLPPARKTQTPKRKKQGCPIM